MEAQITAAEAKINQFIPFYYETFKTNRAGLQPFFVSSLLLHIDCIDPAEKDMIDH